MTKMAALPIYGKTDVGKSRETVFGLSSQRDFQRQSLKSSSADRNKMIKGYVALVS